MRLVFRGGGALFFAVFSVVLSLTLLLSGSSSLAQAVPANLVAELPDSPRPHFDVSARQVDASAQPVNDQPVNDRSVFSSSARKDEQQGTPVAPAAQPALPAASAPQMAPVVRRQTRPDQDAHQKAEQQIKEEEKQRMLGVLPSFNISYRPDAVPLTAAEKFKLAFRTTIDPVTFGIAFVTGGYHEISNDTGFEWGPQGYFERVGAGYLDSFGSTIIGNAVFPSLLHQDPRFFRMGHGSKWRRLFFAASTSFISKSDRTRKWEPNYSNVLGNIAAGELSNFYYPSGDPGDFSLTFTTAMIQTAEGSIGSVLQEFWPDLARKYLHKDPTHGIDAENKKLYDEQDAAKKAKQAAKKTR